MNKQEQAIQYHIDGYNCSQAVLGAFCTELGLDKELAMKLASGFGGGMRCGDMCGAVTGALMAIGLQDGQVEASDQETKMKMNAITSEVHTLFKEKHITNNCRELLGYDITTVEGKEKINELGLSRTKCDRFIADAVTIVEKLLEDRR